MPVLYGTKFTSGKYWCIGILINSVCDDAYENLVMEMKILIRKALKFIIFVKSKCCIVWYAYLLLIMLVILCKGEIGKISTVKY